MSLDLVVAITGDLAWRLPGSLMAVAAGQLSQALARDATGGLLWLLAPLVAGLGWGGVYAVWVEKRLDGPDAVRGLLFAALPFLVGGGLLAPLLAQVADITHVAPVALFTEAVRQVFFGLILGLAYPVLRARHRPDGVADPPAPRAHGTQSADTLAGAGSADMTESATAGSGLPTATV